MGWHVGNMAFASIRNATSCSNIIPVLEGLTLGDLQEQESAVAQSTRKHKPIKSRG